MKDVDPFQNEEIRHLRMFLYLVPILGFFPALWTLYRKQGRKAERSLSRLVVLLACGWLFSYVLLGAGAQSSESFAIPLLITSSLISSGYFIVNIWLMIRLWQRKPLWLPGMGRVGGRLP